MKIKIVIYKENGFFKTTSKDNYDAMIRDARKIHIMEDFKSVEEIKQYYIKWFGYAVNDFIVIE